MLRCWIGEADGPAMPVQVPLQAWIPTVEVVPGAKFAPKSLEPPTTKALAWLKTSKESARNSRLYRSETKNFLWIPKSKFQVPGPRKMLRPVMFEGYGPNSELPVIGFVNSPTEAFGIIT